MLNNEQTHTSGTEKGNTRASWDSENTFAGTAWFYARYRPDYPDQVVNLLREKFGLNDKSRVLDLGCGTGQMALKLAPYVSEIIAMDPQEDMLKEGESLASEKGMVNIKWLLGESKDLAAMAAKIADIDLTVIARAFHWMDREQTLHDLYLITKTGGGVAIIVDSPLGDKSKPRWKEVVDEAVRYWLGEKRKAGTEGTYSHPTKLHEAVLQESEFRDFEFVSIQSERSWSVDQIIGYQYSTSYCSLPVLGDKREPFEVDLRRRLKGIEPSGQFKEPVTIEVMMAWKRHSPEP